MNDDPEWIEELVGKLTLKHQADLADHLLNKTLPRELALNIIEEFNNKLAVRKDFISKLPIELSSYIISLADLQTITSACCLVSKEWLKVCNDSSLWKQMFDKKAWKVDLRKLQLFVETVRQKQQQLSTPERSHVKSHSSSLSAGAQAVDDVMNLKSLEEALPGSTLHLAQKTVESLMRDDDLNWKHIYMTRLQLSRNWKTMKANTFSFKAHLEGIYCLQFDRKKIVTGARDNTLKIWDIETCGLLHILRGHEGSVLCLQFDNRYIISGSSDNNAILWDIDSLKPIHVFSGHTDSVLSVNISKNILVTASKDHTIRLWDIETKTPLQVLSEHHAAINSAVLRGDTIVSASGDRTIKLWNLSSGLCFRTLLGHERGIACLAYDGTTIVSGSSDNTIRIWDAHTGDYVKIIKGHSELVRSVQFDAEKIISVSYDKTIKIWDLSGKLLHDLANCHKDRIYRIEFDHARMITSGHDGTVIVHDFSSDIDLRAFFIS